MNTKTLTIMFVDLVGYTKKTAVKTRKEFLEHLDVYKSVAEPVFPKYKGKVVKEIGDAFMVMFESPTNAVLCGIELQNEVYKHNKNAEKEHKLHIKVAINTGEVHVRGGDLYGDAVNIAARLEKLTEVDRIFFTESVFLSMNKNEVAIGVVGPKRMKGVKHPVKVYTVIGKYERIMRNIRKKKNRVMRKTKNHIVNFLAVLVIAVLVIFAVAAILYYFVY